MHFKFFFHANESIIRSPRVLDLLSFLRSATLRSHRSYSYFRSKIFPGEKSVFEPLFRRGRTLTNWEFTFYKRHDIHGQWHLLHKNTLWWSQVFSEKSSRCGYWLWDCAGDMIYPFPLSELVVCWLSGNILLFPCIWSMQEKHRSFKLRSSSSPICSLSWEFFLSPT